MRQHSSMLIEICMQLQPHTEKWRGETWPEVHCSASKHTVHVMDFQVYLREYATTILELEIVRILFGR